ncbi:DUF3263 domain-containing protein [Actinospica sp.]|jgi:hypothetical protein|uniref:DUF3263 domain-containing protein n=1 Tax=Actinospica sp. TaxID=1872142 RepID=UPI002C43AD8E|nr:DUF3263 domain-containing protein [Actinospica sp.]HWG28795.1 DUF3263 domain-containing protein [Actinospica sp.]
MQQEESRAASVDESAPELPTQRAPENDAQQALFDLPEQPASPEDAEPGAAAADAGTVEADQTPDEPAPPLLGPRERAVLDFESRRFKNAGRKDQAVRDEFGISPTQYFQILNALLDDPAALAHNPTLVARLRRLRDARQQARK